MIVRKTNLTFTIIAMEAIGRYFLHEFLSDFIYPNVIAFFVRRVCPKIVDLCIMIKNLYNKIPQYVKIAVLKTLIITLYYITSNIIYNKIRNLCVIIVAKYYIKS